jgi:hypothetical protein
MVVLEHHKHLPLQSIQHQLLLDPADQMLCNGANTTAVTFTGSVGTATYNWTINTTSIGLAASGTGNIAAFAAVNTGTAPVGCYHHCYTQHQMVRWQEHHKHLPLQ